ncbi:MAG: glycosyltransferase, partial [Candidatus Levyibacteriota bacterium]
ISLYWMLYAWDDPECLRKAKSPTTYTSPHYSFTAIVPARREEKVIEDTIYAIAAIDYPEALKEVIIVCHKNDIKTIANAQEAITRLGKQNILLHIFDDKTINKPHALNIGLAKTTNDIVVVFDAEDSPHKDMYSIINTVMFTKQCDVIQSGVQLMNHYSRWFSAMNVLEYFFWFKSSLHFFSNNHVVPLGGNTVFFKRDILVDIGGWDEDCLTEDADIGIRLSKNTTIQVLYDEAHVTKEETPVDVPSFIRQRTRWNQGFMQVFAKGDWLKLPTLKQKLLAAYVLLSPEIQAVFFILIPFSIFSAISLKLPVIFALLTIIPFFLLLLQLLACNIGMYEFSKYYKQKYSIFSAIKILFTFYPFQFLLGLSAFRACIRTLFAAKNWEKTYHTNAHRENVFPIPTYYST